jgi:hypothetical protein
MAVTIRTCGGFGNQAFQYAFSVALKALGNEVLLECSWFDNNPQRAYVLDRFNTNIEIGPIRGQFVQEGNLRFHPEFLKKYNQDTTFAGYWQNEKYLAGVEDKVRKDLTLRRTPSEKTLAVAREIENSDSIFLHIRRTDTLTEKNLVYHGLVHPDYYKRAASYIATRVPSPHFFVFSDDIEWCKQNIRVFNYPVTFVDHNTTGVTEQPDHEVQKTDNGTEHEDNFLMRLCKHAIIPNSSFAWWAAWLNPNPDKIVVAPRHWFPAGSPHDGSEIPCSTWVRL